MSVVRRIACHGLTRAVAEGDTAAASRAVRGFDPLLRSLARARLRTTLYRARQLTTVDDEAHVSRLALLLLAKRVLEAHHDDVDGVGAEYAIAAGKLVTPRRAKWVTLGVPVLLLAAALIWLTAHRLLRPFSPRDTPVGALLGVRLPEYVEQLGKRDGIPERVRDELLASARAETDLDAESVEDFEALLGRALELSRSDAAGTREAFNRLVAANAGFNAALERRPMRYFLDVETWNGPFGPIPLLLGFYVERERELRSADKTVKALHLWRLDTLNVVQGYLGYTRPYSPAAMVLLDEIEGDLVLNVLPALAPDEPMMLVTEEQWNQGEPWELELRRDAGALMRRYRSTVFGSTLPELETVSKLLAERRRLVTRWREQLSGLGMRLRLPKRLIPERDYATELEVRINSGERRRWDEIHDQLLEPPFLQAFETVRELYVRSVERHEVQHRLDYARDLIPIPERVTAMLGIDNPLAAPPGSMGARTRDELSAHLAEIAQAPSSPTMGVLLFGRHLFGRRSPYYYAAYVAFRGLGEQLGIDVRGRFGTGLSRAEAAKLLVLVAEKPDQEVRKAAARHYRELYGRELDVVERVSEVEHPAWRH